MQRLKTRAQFQAALAGGSKAKTVHFALHSCPLNDAGALHEPPAESLFPLDDVWLGAMVPKRWARRAVTRNCIKRQVHRVSTELAIGLAHGAHVVRLRAGFDRARFPSAASQALKATVRAELLQLFERARVAQ